MELDDWDTYTSAEETVGRISDQMALPIQKEAREGLSILPPSFRLADALSLINDIKDLDRLLDAGEADVTVWRARVMASIRTEFDRLRNNLSDAPRDLVAEALLPVLDDALNETKKAGSGLSIPIGKQPKAERFVEASNKIGGAAGRHLRRQLRRLEELREKYRSVYEAVYYELLAFRSEFDPEATPSGVELRSTDEASAYFRRLMAN